MLQTGSLDEHLLANMPHRLYRHANLTGKQLGIVKPAQDQI